MKNRNAKRTTLAVAALLLILAAGAGAQEAIDETRALDPDARVSIENISGSIVVVGWNRDEIHVEGTLGKGTERLDIDGSNKRLDIEVVLPRHKRNINVEATHLEIHLPTGCRLKIEGISADIEVSEMTGRIDAESVSGDVIVRGRPEEVHAESVSGDLNLEVESQNIEASCVSGDIKLLHCSCRRLDVENISGKVVIEATQARRIDVGTVSGKVRFSGKLGEGSELSIASHSGDITVTLPADLDAEVEMGTFSGTIKSDFGSSRAPKKKYGPGKDLSFILGDGVAHIELGTFSGDLRLIKK